MNLGVHARTAIVTGSTAGIGLADGGVVRSIF